MSSIPKKGPFVDARLHPAASRHERHAARSGSSHLVARLDDLPRHGRPHDRDPRRAQARAGLHHRVHGRSQAGRVRSTRTYRGHAGSDRPRPCVRHGRTDELDRRDPQGSSAPTQVRRACRPARAGSWRTSSAASRLPTRRRSSCASPPAHAADDIRSVLESAIANAVNNHGLEEESLVVAEAFADEG